ncbi:hypothetical protein BKA65DRAFT_516532 [Rhexocercosporidium sp. MPI-PUGE-AT-0058]|nr:hypothetical protein BKA65DRAFT_516532 [Rhexocercosporidium sp. MPI-PUGE-AT-0058]
MTYPLPFDTFHPFPRLPKELRIEIWKVHLTALEPRLLRVWSNPPIEVFEHNECLDPDRESRFLKSECHPSSPNPVPALLQTSQESRHEALRYYTRAFSSRMYQRALRTDTGTGSRSVDTRYVWTNFAIDTIKITANHLPRISDEDRKRIQHMSIDVSCHMCWGLSHEQDFRMLENLKHLEILCSSQLWVWGDTVKEFTDGFRKWFGSVPWYVPPDITFVQTGTWWEMDIHNYEAVMAYGREQWARARADREVEGGS